MDVPIHPTLALGVQSWAHESAGSNHPRQGPQEKLAATCKGPDAACRRLSSVPPGAPPSSGALPRWAPSIEKCFDEVKHKLGKKKAWATSPSRLGHAVTE
jgi:hypothetical protein